jgi:peroxiredoxin
MKFAGRSWPRDYSGRVRSLALVFALCAVALTGCGGETDEAAPTTSPEAVQETPSSHRRAAPPIDGAGLDEEHVSVADLRGRPVLVNVWSSWWTICQSEAVAYAEFKKQHPELAYVGINVADTPDEARAFVDRYGWDWPSIRDPDRELARTLGADYQPHFIVVDERGRIVTTHEGGGDAETWGALAEKLP